MKSILTYITKTIFLTKRYYHNFSRYRFPAENNNWKKIGEKPIYGNTITGSVFDPFVYIENNRFVMIVSERKYHGIDRLESLDGYSWTNTSKILKGIPNTWQSMVNRATILFHEGLWHMWYTGQSNDTSCIGHTTSKDGRSFKNSEYPCIKAELKSEGKSVMNPCVIWNNDKQCFQIWYSAGEYYEPDVLFYAESKDGENWIKYKKPVLKRHPLHLWECKKIGACDVKLNSEGTYEMYYIGYQNIDVARICYATSQNGLDWIRTKNNLLISPSKNRFDSDACYKPTVIEHVGKMFMWYNGRHQNTEYIGLAVKYER